MRFLLTTLNAKYIHVNLAIRILFEQNRDVEGLEWKEFTIKRDLDEIAEECSTYEFVAFSCYIWNIVPTLKVCEKIKQINPECVILLGGPEVSYEYDDIISRSYVDYIIAGEGEIAFSQFVRNFPDVTETPGLVRWVNDRSIVNPAAPAFDVANFADSMPYQFDDPASLASRVTYIETSRGCPYKCEFCLASLDNKVRYLPMEQIQRTLLFLMNNARVIKFLDRTFNMKRDFTLGIFQFILDHHKPRNVFQFEITADILHPDIIAFIREKVPAGLFRFEIGIQSVNEQANLSIKRKQNFNRTRDIILQIRDKVEMHLDLIVGLPYDRMENIRDGFIQVFDLQPSELQLGFLKFLKGTPMRDKHEHGYEFDPYPPYELIKSKYLTEEEIHRIKLLEAALEIYWNGKKAVHALKYVHEHHNIFDFLENLGAFVEKRFDLHRHRLEEVYDAIFDFVLVTYPSDAVLKELVAMEYYLHHKLFPHPKYLDVTKLQSDDHSVRRMSIQLSFDFSMYREQGKIELRCSDLVIEYDGKQTALVVSCLPSDTKTDFVSLNI